MKFFCTMCVVAAMMAAAAVESVPGVRGMAVKIDGRKAFLADPGSGDFNFTEGMTASLFFKADEWAQNATLIANAGTFGLRKRAKNNKGFYFDGNIGGKPGTALLWNPELFPALPGRWVHIAVTYDNRTGIGTGYVNGRRTATRDVKSFLSGAQDYALRGKALPGTRFTLGSGTVPYIGQLDEVYIYGRVLDDAEISALFKGRAPEGALAAYTMDDPQNPGLDSSGNQRHLKIEEGFLNNLPPRTGKVIKTDYLIDTPAVSVWGRPATEKNMPADRPELQKRSEEPLARLAANEYESFQLAISPRRNLKNATLELSALKLEDQVLEARIGTVDYVAIPTVSQTTIKSGPVFGEAAASFNVNTAQPGYYPDVLRNGNCFPVVAADESAAFWITVKSTPTQRPGCYRGTGKLTAEGGITVEFPVSVEVWDFALPEKFHTANSGIARDNLGADSDALYRNCAEHYVSLTPLRGDVQIQVDDQDKLTVDTAAFDREAEKALGQYQFSVLYFPGWGFYQMPRARQDNADWNGVRIQQGGRLTERFKKVFGDYLRLMSAHLARRGWLDKTRITLVDEPWTEGDFQLCREFAALVRAHAPEVKIMLTKWPQKGLMEVPDIWCLGFFHHDDMRAALKKGEKLEWYPNWHVLIDRPLMDSRMIGCLMWKYQITGILFWKLNEGWSNRRNLEAPRFVYRDGRVICGNGLLIYPDEKNNPLSSIRWEMLRDAFEDFEYFYYLDGLAAQCGDVPEARAARQLAAEICDSIVPGYEALPAGEGNGWKHTVWEFDARKLQEYRRRLAAAIVKLKKTIGQ